MNTQTATAVQNPQLFTAASSPNEKAARLHRLLLDLTKDEDLSDEKELKSAVRATADFFREKFFGFTEKKIRSSIKEVLSDYFDGETYQAIEIDNLSEQTGIKEDILLPVLKKMVAKGEILEGRRRRWQEFGEHYNALYKLNREKQLT